MTLAGVRLDLTAAFSAAALLACASFLLFQPGPSIQLILLVPFVALLGVPHGALDLRVASDLWPLPTAWALALFAAIYLGLGGAVLAVWALAPEIALPAFFVYSAVHFAGDWRDRLPPLPRLSAGVLVVAAPALAWPAEVTRILAALAPQEVAADLVGVLRVLAPIAALVLGAGLWRLPRTVRSTLVELGGLMLLALLTPPLVYFIVYFCFLHSPRHFEGTIRRLRLSRLGGIIAALPLTMATWAIATAAILFVELPSDVATLRLVFIGLAALAVPHMVLVERFWTRSSDLPA
jgi:Brp/Blh family beta-carotene 15,15'-monooxygenase